MRRRKDDFFSFAWPRERQDLAATLRGLPFSPVVYVTAAYALLLRPWQSILCLGVALTLWLRPLKTARAVEDSSPTTKRVFGSAPELSTGARITLVTIAVYGLAEVFFKSTTWTIDPPPASYSLIPGFFGLLAGRLASQWGGPPLLSRASLARRLPLSVEELARQIWTKWLIIVIACGLAALSVTVVAHLFGWKPLLATARFLVWTMLAAGAGAGWFFRSRLREHYGSERPISDLMFLVSSIVACLFFCAPEIDFFSGAWALCSYPALIWFLGDFVYSVLPGSLAKIPPRHVHSSWE